MSTRRKSSRASFGSVRKLPSGRYQARYTDARDVRHTAPHTFVTKRQADDWLATVQSDMAHGTWRAPELGAVTLADYAADHLATRLDLAPKTRQTYADALSGWIATPLELPTALGRRPRTVDLGAVELGSLSVGDVRQWYAAALHTSQQRAAARTARGRQGAAVHAARAWARTQGLTVADVGRLPVRVTDAWERAGRPATLDSGTSAGLTPSGGSPGPEGRAVVAQAYRVLRMILSHAVTEGRVLANPCTIPGAGLVRHRERVPATPSQIHDLAAAMPARYAAAVHVAAWSGLRAGELFGLARRHVDLEAGTVRVERQAVTSLGATTPYLGPTKTEASRRTVHLPGHIVVALQAHMEAHTGPGPDSLVFTDPAGRIVSRETRQRAFYRARTIVGLPDLRWHDLRHTGATLAAQSGATLAELKARLGHSTVAAAMVYQHASPERDRDLADRMDRHAGPRLVALVPPLPAETGVTAAESAGMAQTTGATA